MKGIFKRLSPKAYTFIFLIILLLSAFYWYEIRPARIRADCHKWVADKKVYLEDYKIYYEGCLHSKGLK